MAKDILFDEPFANGDFNIGFSDEQHIKHLIVSAPGHFKNVPLLGVNIKNWINGSMSPSEQQELESSIRLNLEADGVTQITTAIDQKTFEIDVNGKYR
jgi:hypothetical protein